MKKLLEHPIISTVVGGLTLSLLAWLGGLWPSIWAAIVSGVKTLWDVMVFPIPVPAVFVVAGVLLLIAWIQRHRKNAEAKQTPEEQGDVLQQIAASLSPEERKLLSALGRLDGQPISGEDCRHVLQASNLRAIQVVETLVEKQLVQDNRRYGRSEIYLTRLGRDLILRESLVTEQLGT